MQHIDEEEWEDVPDDYKEKHTFNANNGNNEHAALHRNVSQSDFTCGCCYELMVQPTTLNCGHSFCRICLARWFLTSSKSECPTCRQQWQGVPAVNIVIRNLIDKSFKSEYLDREQNIMTSEAKSKLDEFEKRLTTAPQKKKEESQAKDFCSGILFALGIILIVYLAWYWRNSDVDLLIYKPASRWTIDDVGQWLNDLGEWTANYAYAANVNKIDGSLLLGIDSESIESNLNVTDSLHQKAILQALQLIKDQGVKQPATLWEFKSLHPGYALFILYGLKDYPRSTMLYLYFFKYEDLFLPIVQSCSPALQDDPTAYLFSGQQPKQDQFIDFVSRFTFIPYWMVARFTWNWLDIHFWTSRFVLANCIALTILECNAIRWFFYGGWRQGRYILKDYGKGCASAVVFMIIWPIIPSFICDVFFYVALYFSPYLNFEKIYKTIRDM